MEEEEASDKEPEIWPYWMAVYRKTPKNLDSWKFAVITLKVEQWFYLRAVRPKVAEGIANSVDPDQTALLGAIWSGSALFAQAYLSENLGSLWRCIWRITNLLSVSYVFLW